MAPQIEQLVGVINARLREIDPPLLPQAPPRTVPITVSRGRSYDSLFTEAMALKRAKKFAEAEPLFQAAIEAHEAEVYAHTGPVLASDNYMQLAIVQRALGDADGEVRTLERYIGQVENPWMRDRFQERLDRLRKKMGQQSAATVTRRGEWAT